MAWGLELGADKLGSAEGVHEGGGILYIGFPGLQEGNTGVTAAPHHIQCGGGCGGDALSRGDG